MAGATTGQGTLKAALSSPHPHPVQTHSAMGRDLFSLGFPSSPRSGRAGTLRGRKGTRRAHRRGLGPGRLQLSPAHSLGLGLSPGRRRRGLGALPGGGSRRNRWAKVGSPGERSGGVHRRGRRNRQGFFKGQSATQSADLRPVRQQSRSALRAAGPIQKGRPAPGSAPGAGPLPASQTLGRGAGPQRAPGQGET